MRQLLLCLLVLFTSPTLLADREPPATPEGIVATAQSTNSVSLSWNVPVDNVGVAGYNVYRNGLYHNTTFTNQFTDTQVRAGNTYSYSVTAFDDARNYTVHSPNAVVQLAGTRSASSSSNSSDSADSSRPLPPGNIRGTAEGNDAIRLQWNAAPGDILGYNIYRNGRYESTVKRTTEFTDTGLNRNQEYRYRVVSFTSEPQYSTLSDEIAVRTSNNGSSRGQNDSQTQVQPANDGENNQADNDGVDNTGGAPNGYSLVFSDEFNGNNINDSKWNTRYRWGPNWIINGEKQYYVDTQDDPDLDISPFQFGNGTLSITASRTPDNQRSNANNQRYISGALTSYGKFRMRYGYVEMRARMPNGRGLWPAFWLLHQNGNGNRPEIDVVEMLGQNTRKVFHTYHHYNNSELRSTPSYETEGPDFSAGFHTYGMLWEPGRITWYVDGQVSETYSSGNVSSEDMYILVNLAVGGYWPGDPDGSTNFPARYSIDYIRAYQQD